MEGNRTTCSLIMKMVTMKKVVITMVLLLVTAMDLSQSTRAQILSCDSLSTGPEVKSDAMQMTFAQQLLLPP